MRRLVFALLLGLAVPLPLNAQSVTLTVCNTGKVDVDVFVSLSNSHVRPATCVAVTKSSGAMEPAYLGLAFTDARGQWGAARRFNGIPYMGVRESVARAPYILSGSTRSATVRHGNGNVSLPMQLLFQPPDPECRAVPTGGGATIGRTTIVEVKQVCEDLGYTLKVEAYPDSREIRLASLPTSGFFSDRPLGTVSISEKADVNWAEEEAERKAREEPVPVNWNDLLPVLRTQNGSRRLRDVLPGYIVIRGTVSEVEVSPGENNTQVVNVAFVESPFVTLRPGAPYSEFNACTTSLDVLQDVFGADFRTSMIGTPIEVRGEPWGVTCRGLRGGIGITLARQIRPVASVEFAAGTRVWVPPASALPPPGMTPEKASAALAKEAADQETRVACAQEAGRKYPQSWRSDQIVGYQNAVRACLVAAGLSAPAPAVDNRPPMPSPSAEPAATMPAPPPVVSTFSTAPAPRAGALSIADFTSQWVGKAVVATGTVARVETIQGFEHLYFQGAGSKFVVCFAQGFGGVKNASGLIGRTVEVSVRIDSPVGCLDHRIETVGATEIRQLNQLRLIGDARPVK